MKLNQVKKGYLIVGLRCFLSTRYQSVYVILSIVGKKKVVQRVIVHWV